MKKLPTPHRRPAVALFAVAGAAVSAACLPRLALAELPPYHGKPPTWSTGLVAEDGTVWDAELADWIKTLNTAAHQQVDSVPEETPWILDVRCTFTMCYGGGFLKEIHNALAEESGVDFGANSASRYYEPCSAKANDYSRYAQAWSSRAAVSPMVHTDLQITDAAHTALLDGSVAGIPQNPQRHTEHPQYKGRDDNSPFPLHAGDHQHGCANYAVLFAGEPEARHKNNVTTMRNVLINDYGWPEENIYILYGSFGAGTAPGGVDWTSNGAATVGNLEEVFTQAGGWLLPRIAAYAAAADPPDKLAGGTVVQVFFWATNHGTVSAPAHIAVGPGSTGVNGTDVLARSVVGDEEQWIYEGGAQTNSLFMDLTGLGGSIDALSYGSDAVLAVPPADIDEGSPDDAEKAARSRPGVYFCVTGGSDGLANTGVWRRLNPPIPLLPLLAKSSVFAASSGGNDEMILAPAMGLLEAANDADAVTALSLAIPVMAGSSTVFVSLAGSPQIHVYDPWLLDADGNPQPGWYVFWDPATAAWPKNLAKPQDIDGLAMYINVSRALRDPVSGKLVFKAGKDQILFSVPAGDAMNASGCSVFRYSGKKVDTVYVCADLGLANGDDLSALHTYDSRAPGHVRSSDGDNEDLPADPECSGAGSWTEDFDDYAQGLLVHQCGWSSWDDDPDVALFEVTQEVAFSAPSAVRIAGLDDAVHEVSEMEGGRWRFSARQYVPSSMTDIQELLLLNTYESGGEKNWSLQLAFYGTEGLVYDWVSGGILPLITDEWVEIEVIIDLDEDTQEISYGGELLAVSSWTEGGLGGGASRIAAVDLWAAGAAEGVYYDDLVLEPADDDGGGGDCPGDINGDGSVNVSDLVEVILFFGTPYGPADLNDDGIVNVVDLTLVIVSWGPCM